MDSCGQSAVEWELVMKHLMRGVIFWLALVLLGLLGGGPNPFGAMLFVIVAAAATSWMVEKSS